MKNQGTRAHQHLLPKGVISAFIGCLIVVVAVCAVGLLVIQHAQSNGQPPLAAAGSSDQAAANSSGQAGANNSDQAGQAVTTVPGTGSQPTASASAAAVSEEPPVNLGLVKDGPVTPTPAYTASFIFQRAFDNGLLVRNGSMDESTMPVLATDPLPYATEASWSNYLRLDAYYQKAFEVYILKTLRLDLLDHELVQTSLGFGPLPADRQSTYQQRTALNLECLYIRCAGYNIEMLDSTDAATLERLADENGSVVTDEALDLVARTFKDVVRQYTATGMPYVDTRSFVCFPHSTSDIGYNPNALVIVVPNVEGYDENGQVTVLESDLQQERQNYLLQRLPVLAMEYQNILGMPVNFVITDGVFDNQPDHEYPVFSIGDWGVFPAPDQS
ncbi:MAG: hypothetical protein FWF30_00275 [Coriobacteriia bacterium]|nr:hypothetical protein [Coriobacteriia bacterium]